VSISLLAQTSDTAQLHRPWNVAPSLLELKCWMINLWDCFEWAWMVRRPTGLCAHEYMWADKFSFILIYMYSICFGESSFIMWNLGLEKGWGRKWRVQFFSPPTAWNDFLIQPSLVCDVTFSQPFQTRNGKFLKFNDIHGIIILWLSTTPYPLGLSHTATSATTPTTISLITETIVFPQPLAFSTNLAYLYCHQL
jgi:hypothetical protein